MPGSLFEGRQMVLYNFRLTERKWKDREDRILRGGRREYPEELLECYGYDVLTVYSSMNRGEDHDEEMLEGIFRFLNRVTLMYSGLKDRDVTGTDDAADTVIYETLCAASKAPVLMKHLKDFKDCGRETFEKYLKLLSDMAPFICQDMWAGLGNPGFISEEEKPAFDPKKVCISIPVELDGRFRKRIRIRLDEDEESIRKRALEALGQEVNAAEIKDTVFVENRVINIVTKDSKEMKNSVKRGSALGQAIRRYRRMKGLTQADFAGMADVTVNTVHSWETSTDSKPSVASIDTIARIMEIPVAEAMELSLKPAAADPVLVIMAAGMGSRYGGLKQIDRLNADGDIIIDFSIFDAIRAGFGKVIFIIRKEHRDAFEEVIVGKIRPFAEVEYVYQDLQDVPEGVQIPEGREKPWGTGQAILACRDSIDGPFLVINADDYYGVEAFERAYDFLSDPTKSEDTDHMMIGYEIQNTITDNGYVSRGVCSVNDDMELTGIHERKKIEKRENGQAFLEADGVTWTPIENGTVVSMNMWGFQQSIFDILEEGFGPFFEKQVTKDALKSEYLLPEVVGEMINEQKGRVSVIKTSDKWFGVTYKEDKQMVVNAVERLKAAGVYPEHLWKK